MCHVLCHDCQTTVRRYLGLDNPTSWDVTGTITIRQCAKAKALAAMFGVVGERRATPMTPAAQANLRAACEGDTMADIARYQSGVGSLLHLSQCVRPDIAAPVGALAAYN
jgi:hypothetical protein